MFHKLKPPACRRCKSRKMMEPSGVAILKKPTLLHLSCEYAPVRQHSPMRMDLVDPAEPAVPISQSDEPPASYFRSTLGFTIDCSINVDSAIYRWVGSIFHSQAHFWCVVPGETDI